ncbi:MAG: transporter substrate-binding domain-containing protein [Pseudomonadota bacterium]|nr:transporter substrate-binding domain-containing protein [Pseudomonadota bacterium]
MGGRIAFKSIRVSVVVMAWLFSGFFPAAGVGAESLVGKADSGRKPLLISAHPEFPPVMWKKGDTIVGTSSLLAKTIFAELGISCKIVYSGPWKRVQHEAENGRIDLISGIYYNDERNRYLLYTKPYMDDPTSIIVAVGKAFPCFGREALIGKRGVAPFGDSFGEEFDLFIKDRLQVIRPYTLQLCFQALLEGRADYLLFGYYSALIGSKTFGYLDQIEVVNREIDTTGMYMAFSRKSEYCYLLPQVNRIIERLRKNGTIAKWNAANLASYPEAVLYQAVDSTKK